MQQVQRLLMKKKWYICYDTKLLFETNISNDMSRVILAYIISLIYVALQALLLTLPY